MILADTSVWIDYLHRNNVIMHEHLQAERIRMHPFVAGEIACGHIKNRKEILALFRILPTVHVVDHQEALDFIDEHRLWGKGLSWVDVSLLASALIMGDQLWTFDKALGHAAVSLNVSI